jgi:hypothetical protein
MEITCGNYETTYLQDHVVYNELELKKLFMATWMSSPWSNNPNHAFYGELNMVP